MYGSDAEDVIFYLTVYNEPVCQPAEPEDVDVEGILDGLHHVSTGEGEGPRVQLLASGVGYPWIAKAQQLLATTGASRPTPGRSPRGTSCPATPSRSRSGTSTNPRRDAHAVRHPQARRSPRPGRRGQRLHEGRAAADLTLGAARYHALGADGFGFADTRAAARRFFKIDAESVVVQALQALAEEGVIRRQGRERHRHYRIADPTAVRDVKQEGGDA